MAALSMLEARIRRVTGNQIKEKLSVQHVLDCSVYNQGCNGGYAYLVLKFGSEVELVPESCMKYQVIFLSYQIV
jgi:cathepsin C